jgi:precorrin-6B methylase 2
VSSEPWHLSRRARLAPSRAVTTKRRIILLALALLPLVYLASAVPEMRHAWSSHWSSVDDPERDAAPITAKTLAALAVQPGMSVADVGAGVGYYAFKLARLVGPTGRVYATDRDQYAVAAIWAHRLVRGVSNVVPMHVRSDHLGLAPDSVDRILIFNVYPFENCRPERTQALLTQAAEALRRDGRLVIYHDWVHDDEWEPPSGSSPECSQPDAQQLAAAARDRFDVVQLEENARGPAGRPGKRPGYLLILERRD